MDQSACAWWLVSMGGGRHSIFVHFVCSCAIIWHKSIIDMEHTKHNNNGLDTCWLEIPWLLLLTRLNTASKWFSYWTYLILFHFLNLIYLFWLTDFFFKMVLWSFIHFLRVDLCAYWFWRWAPLSMDKQPAPPPNP